MKKIMMMAVAAFLATVSANAQFEKGTWSLQPYAGGVVSSVTNVDNFDIGDGVELERPDCVNISYPAFYGDLERLRG